MIAAVVWGLAAGFLARAVFGGAKPGLLLTLSAGFGATEDGAREKSGGKAPRDRRDHARASSCRRAMPTATPRPRWCVTTYAL